MIYIETTCYYVFLLEGGVTTRRFKSENLPPHPVYVALISLSLCSKVALRCITGKELRPGIISLAFYFYSKVVRPHVLH